MIVLLGASGYMGQAFTGELRRRGLSFVPLARSAIDYTNFNLLFDYLRKMRPEFLINASGFTGRPDEDACEFATEETLAANTLLPQTIARACSMTNTPWGHVSSGAIYAGAKFVENGRMRIERNLNSTEARWLLTEHPERVFGFNELDTPNASFRNAPCSFYSGSKALAEEAIQEIKQGYIWRPGVPFNDLEHPRNFLWRIHRNGKLWDNVNSLTHLDDFARACLTLWDHQAAFGIYNIVNGGAISTRQVLEVMKKFLNPNRQFEFCDPDGAANGSHAPICMSHCILDGGKLRGSGVVMRSVEEALADAGRHWRSGSFRPEMALPERGLHRQAVIGSEGHQI